MKALTTLGVLSLPLLERRLDASVVGWAIDMLERGYDSGSLRILSSLSEPLNEFELAHYLELSLTELGIPTLSERKLFSSYLLETLSEPYESVEELRDRLIPISAAIAKRDYPSEQYDLYLLFHAVDSLLECGDQHYIDNFSLEQIPEILKAQIKALSEQSVQLPFFRAI
jgi:hypothetical protein